MQAADTGRVSATGLLLRAGLFVFAVWVGGVLIGTGLNALIGYFPAAALSVFLSAAIASAIVVRVYERGRLEDVGMGWTAASMRHLALGFAGGVCAVAIVLVPSLASGMAQVIKSPGAEDAFSPGRLLYVSALLLFGAAGEELMFRGYAFQLLLRSFGPWQVMLPFSVVFAAVHMNNPNATTLGLVNTGVWGLVLGFALWRSGDLWLPIGVHFGWNWALPMAGLGVSGFTMKLTGYEVRWKVSPLWSGGAYGPEGGLLTTFAAGLIALWLWRLRLERQPSLFLASR